MSVRTRRKRAGDSLLGLSIRLTASLLTIILVGDVFPFALLIYTDFRAEILVYWGVGGLVASPVAFTFFLRRYFKKAGPLTGNSRDEWTALVNVFAAVFAVAGVLLAFSSIGEQPVTRSQCLYPVNANVSSPNCQVIETVSLPNRGPYSYLGILGIWIVIVGLIGVAMVTIFSIFLYLAYGLEARSTRS